MNKRMITLMALLALFAGACGEGTQMASSLYHLIPRGERMGSIASFCAISEYWNLSFCASFPK